jgi:hypothetical protein
MPISTSRSIGTCLTSRYLGSLSALSVTALLNADVLSRTSQGGYGDISKEQLTEYEISNKQLASIVDIADSMKQQLLILVEWAKYIPTFSRDLCLDDQVRKTRNLKYIIWAIPIPGPVYLYTFVYA